MERFTDVERFGAVVALLVAAVGVGLGIAGFFYH